MKKLLPFILMLLLLCSCAVYKFENYVTVNEISIYQENGKEIITEKIPQYSTISFSKNKTKKGYPIYYKRKKWYLTPGFYSDILPYYEYVQKYKTQPTVDNTDIKPKRNYSTSNSSSYGGSVKVKGYYRKDGTYVKPHTRKSPKRK